MASNPAANDLMWAHVSTRVPLIIRIQIQNLLNIDKSTPKIRFQFFFLKRLK